MLHKMKLKESPFERIKDGTKTVEFRLYDEKRRLIKIGDIIKFTNNKTNESIYTLVTDLHIYKDFSMLYSKFPKTRLGYLENEIAKPEDMEVYYSKENIDKYGALGIEVKKLNF